MKKRITIGVLIGNANSPHSMNIMEGITKAAAVRDVNVIYYLGIHSSYSYRSYFGAEAGNDFDYQSNIVYDYVDVSDVDALIILYGTMGRFLEDPNTQNFLGKFQGIPYVLLEDRVESPNAVSIIADNYHGMYEIVKHLVEVHKCKNITYLSGPLRNTDSEERLKAMIDYMRSQRLPFDRTRVEYGDFSEYVEHQVRRLFEAYPQMDAMICANDMMAATAYRVAKEMGRTVGKDLAITGYDDWDACEYMDPPLTTVLQNSGEMGEMALMHAISLYEGNYQGEKTIVVPASQRRRGSCGCEYRENIDPDKLQMRNQVLSTEKNRYSLFQQESWFLPLISRDMISHVDRECEFYRRACAKLHALRSKNSYIYIFDQPITHLRGGKWTCPDKLYLMSCHLGDEVFAYSRQDAPILSREKVLSEFHRGDEAFSMSIYPLFSEEKQYGILVAEISPSDMALFYLISMQIANAIKSYSFSIQQESINQELAQKIQEVHEKNEILSFLSTYDSMTGCLNRRGFIEEAVNYNRKYDGQDIYVIYADTDHLKEINDKFGHGEGDYAISRCAAIIQKLAGTEGIAGRIGGDEFAVILPAGDDKDLIELIRQVKEENRSFNNQSSKPYYIEVSIGWKRIHCCQDLNLVDVLKAADEAMYGQKRLRRASVSKHKDYMKPMVKEFDSINEYHPLTGLYNEDSYFYHAEEFLDHVDDAMYKQYCIVAVDIEHFRMFNKWYGRSEGDAFLVMVAKLLQEKIPRGEGVLGYLGGDNFVILMKNDQKKLIEIQHKIQEYLAKSHVNSTGFLPAFGIYEMGVGVMSVSNMYDRAVVAQTSLSGQYSRRIAIYNTNMFEEVEKELLLISEVKTALEKHEFTFYVQPQYDIENMSIIGAESLVRWIHPSKGMIPPGVFIPILERNGFISDLDRYTWEAVCSWLRKWIDSGNTPVPISINVSRVDIFLIDVPKYICELLERYQIDSSLLKIEITESAYSENDETIISAVNALREAGCTVLMDDFGSGYSSMNMLKNVSVDVLKLDMKFLDINDVNEEKGINILKSVVEMAHGLKLPIIIEGVETQQQEKFLLDMNCRYTQGYYYQRPMPVQQFEDLLIKMNIKKLEETLKY